MIDSVFPQQLSLSVYPVTYPGIDWLTHLRVEIQRLLAQPFSILLDSAQSSQRSLGRYDIFCANPRHQLVSLGESTIVDGQTVNIPITQALNQLLPRFNHDEQLPFTGGAIGYLSYEYGKQLETLPFQSKDDLKVPVGQFGIYTWSFVVDHHAKRAYFCDWQPDEHSDLRTLFESVSQTPPSTSESSTHPSFNVTCAWSSNMSQRQYVEAVTKIKDYILNGDVYQVNLAQRWQTGYSGDIWQGYLHLRNRNKAPFSAFLNFLDFQILSFSPERFFCIENKKVTTMPIKGTINRSGEEIEDALLRQTLEESEKDRAENLMIVDLLRNDMSRVCEPHSVKVTKLFEIQSYPAVHHLVSTIEATLPEGLNSIDLIENAFPGGSITGAPKIRAQQIIDELEPNVRSIYCGSIIAIDFNGNTDSNIAIRTVVAKAGNLYTWGGGGIVWDSDPQSEYAETLAKVSMILTEPTINKAE